MSDYDCPTCGSDPSSSTVKPFCSEECETEALDDGFDAKRVKREKMAVLKRRDQQIANRIEADRRLGLTRSERD